MFMFSSFVAHDHEYVKVSLYDSEDVIFRVRCTQVRQVFHKLVKTCSYTPFLPCAHGLA